MMIDAKKFVWPVHSHQAIERQRAVIRAAETRVPELQAQWSHALKHRCEAQRKPVFQPERYRFHKIRMAELEVEIARARSRVELERDKLIMMLPEPHKPRRIKSAPTKYVRDADGHSCLRSN